LTHTSSTKLPKDKKEKQLMAYSGAEQGFINSVVFSHHERQKENPAPQADVTAVFILVEHFCVIPFLQSAWVEDPPG